ncbi:Amino-transferase class IV [Candidatus Bilamarchaeum dharawalense]|uniref:Branched-chain-amino-acid aminotransferase n=1 Tax=Candidatus Bilamarchaeum dharawalense TaxID=2885759 RepID=A0A5E4LLY1_9ARCH|nr:Amino-transferase class IV [Candidatus Bilamarchaeum dharawalense]
MKPLSKIWMDGKFVNWDDAKIHVLTHGLHYGTAIFEGMRCYDTKNGPAVFRMKDHYHRLFRGAKAYEFKINYSQNHLISVTKELIRKNKVKSCYIRPICYIGYSSIGINMLDKPFHLSIIPVDFAKYFGKKAELGISCTISSWRRISANILSPHVKASANYLNSALAKVDAINGGYDEAIMLSQDGHVSEGTGENVFVYRDGELVTPPLYDGVLAGLTRDSVIQIAIDLGIPIRERSILRDELYTADEMFLCGTAAEITPVLSVDKRQIGDGKKPGEITNRIRKRFFDIVSGKDERFVKWLDFVD